MQLFCKVFCFVLFCFVSRKLLTVKKCEVPIFLYLFLSFTIWLCTIESFIVFNPYGVDANVQDCDILTSEFELQSRYYVHFRTNIHGKGVKPLIFPAIG